MEMNLEPCNGERQQTATELSILFEISKIIVSTPELDGLLQRVAVKIVEMAEPVDACALFLFDERSDKLVVRASYGQPTPLLSRLQLSAGEDVVGEAFRSMKPVICSIEEKPSAADNTTEVGDQHLIAHLIAMERRQASRWAICLPLIYQGRALGVLFLENRSSPRGPLQPGLTLVQALANQLAAAIENVYLQDELRRKEELRGQLLEKVIYAQEAERKRIARELHDEASQALTALLIGLESAEEAMPAEMAHTRHQLVNLKGLTLETLEEIRKLIVDLRPTLLDDLGLIPALRWYTKTHAERSGIQMKFIARGFKERLPSQMETALFRIVQEALTNITKHSQASKGNVKMAMRNAVLTAIVEDNGAGFDVRETLDSCNKDRGLGILGMRERVSLLGGSFSIHSRVGIGTRIVVEVPTGDRQGQDKTYG